MAEREVKKKAAAAEERGASPRLPAGRHGLPREFVVRNQRERIVTALVDAVAEHGYNATTVAQITKGAAVSRRTFYEHFDDKEACFLAAYEMIDEHVRASMRAAAESADEWPQKVRAALEQMLRFLAEEPELAPIFMIEPIAAGGEIANRHRATMQSVIEILKAGRPEYAGQDPLPQSTEEALVGGIVSLVVREISAGRAEELEALLPDLVELAMTPYVGVEEAERLART